MSTIKSTAATPLTLSTTPQLVTTGAGSAKTISVTSNLSTTAYLLMFDAGTAPSNGSTGTLALDSSGRPLIVAPASTGIVAPANPFAFTSGLYIALQPLATAYFEAVLA